MLIFKALEMFFCPHIPTLQPDCDIFLPKDVFIISFEMPPAYPSHTIVLLHLPSRCTAIVDSVTQTLLKCLL